MQRFDLNGTWTLSGGGYDCRGVIPGSVYSFLLDNKLIDDPYYRDNELKLVGIMDNEFEFSREFDYLPDGNKVLLCCDGLDTLCDIYLNGAHIAYTDNMHRSYEFDVTADIKNGKNEIKLLFHPADAYIKEKEAQQPTFYAKEAMAGFGNIRKAHCMFGWDWGPRLPDAGIWKDIYLLKKDSVRISDIYITQRHDNGRVFVMPNVTLDGKADISVTCTAPDGSVTTLSANAENEIANPQLWMPRGLGEQPLYTIDVKVTQNGKTADRATRRIGLRTVKLIREKDKWGESFCHEVNGVRFFAMGADYVPEDNILSRLSEQRTRDLIKQCCRCNFNCLRVWGGGFYPHDYFFDICDEMGITVFVDLMFACSSMNPDDAMMENIRIEAEQNLARLRHHPSIVIISGNNEIELWCTWQPVKYPRYLEVFEDLLADVANRVCPDIPYVPSSPSSIGHFMDPQNQNFGDCHYYGVWCGQPITEYRNNYWRYLSEFGVQSFPGEKTVNSFTLPEDRNVFSRVMEMHQRSIPANKALVQYISENFKYPNSLPAFLYATQLFQAEAIKYCVEHLRRNRGRCMGALYWQLNDIWPVASWASIDCYGRYKALQYYAKRFFEPVLISCREVGENDVRPFINTERNIELVTTAELTVTNDTLSEVTGTVNWALRDSKANVIKSGEQVVTVPALSYVTLDNMDFNKTDPYTTYISYSYTVGGNVVSSGTTLFAAHKRFDFEDPHLRCEVNGDEITVYADCYAKAVEIDSLDSDFILSDNYFDMNAGSHTIKILEGTPKTIQLRSVYDIR